MLRRSLKHHMLIVHNISDDDQVHDAEIIEDDDERSIRSKDPSVEAEDFQENLPEIENDGDGGKSREEMKSEEEEWDEEKSECFSTGDDNDGDSTDTNVSDATVPDEIMPVAEAPAAEAPGAGEPGAGVPAAEVAGAGVPAAGVAGAGWSAA